LDELIREEIRKLEDDGWIVYFSWVKAHDNNHGNELADQLTKEAACDNNRKITYNKYPKSSVTSELTLVHRSLHFCDYRSGKVNGTIQIKGP
jgi:hypothetical protein